MATPQEIDAALTEVFIRQITWKPSVMRNVAIKIVARALLEDDRIFWADDLQFDFVEAADKNCIGMAWRQLMAAGIISRMDLHRRSTREVSKGRTVFKYRLVSDAKAKTFLQRNGWTGKLGAKGERYLFNIEELNGLATAKLPPVTLCAPGRAQNEGQ